MVAKAVEILSVGVSGAVDGRDIKERVGTGGQRPAVLAVAVHQHHLAVALRRELGAGEGHQRVLVQHIGGVAFAAGEGGGAVRCVVLTAPHIAGHGGLVGGQVGHHVADQVALGHFGHVVLLAVAGQQGAQGFAGSGALGAGGGRFGGCGAPTGCRRGGAARQQQGGQQQGTGSFHGTSSFFV